jgi:hypothetical protein
MNRQIYEMETYEQTNCSQAYRDTYGNDASENDIQTDRWTDRQTDRWTDGQMRGVTDGRTDEQMHRQTDVRTDRQTDRIYIR